MKILKRIMLGLVALIVLIAVFLLIRLNTIPTREIDLSNLEIPEDAPSEVVEENKTVAQTYYQELYSDGYADAINTYLSDDYIEHQSSAEYSKAGLEAYIQQKLTEHPEHQVTIHRVIAQGNLVFLHVEENLANSDVARGELFRIADGKIIEHWSSEQVVPEEPANDNGMFAGPSPNLESDAGKKYAEKAVVDAFEAWMNYDTDRVLESTTERYIQHNPQGQSGAAAFANVIRLFKLIHAVTGQGVDIVTYRVMGEGDFVVTQTLYTDSSGPQHVFDILRFTEEGQKDEHWDVIEPIAVDEIEKIY